MKNVMSADLSAKNEFIRKLIHISTVIIPLSYFYYLEKRQASILCIGIFLIFFFADLFRIFVTQMKQIYENILGKLLRLGETGKKLNGATLLFLGYALTTLIFEKEIAVISMMILALADSSAAIIGKSYGKKKIFNKTIEGTVAFFIVTFLVSIFFYDNIGAIILAAILISVFELFSGKLNDNISIPIFSGIIFTLVKNF